MKNRNTINELMLGATAAVMLNTMKKKLQLWYNGNLPYISLKGAMTSEC
jgi:hypothetical protein